MLLEKYTSEWNTKFNIIKHEIEKTLSGILVAIEHIGSTSVPNLDAKPIIDIDIVFAEQLDFEKIKFGLEQIGYYHNGNQGIDDRDVFKRNGETRHEILDSITHHLYVCPAKSRALERHILSRDFLRKNEWAKIKYQQMKYELAEKANQDKKVYAALKELNINDFIDFIVNEEKQSIQ